MLDYPIDHVISLKPFAQNLKNILPLETNKNRVKVYKVMYTPGDCKIQQISLNFLFITVRLILSSQNKIKLRFWDCLETHWINTIMPMEEYICAANNHKYIFNARKSTD